jgi:hypothetical protein
MAYGHSGRYTQWINQKIWNDTLIIERQIYSRNDTTDGPFLTVSTRELISYVGRQKFDERHFDQSTSDLINSGNIYNSASRVILKVYVFGIIPEPFYSKQQIVFLDVCIDFN